MYFGLDGCLLGWIGIALYDDGRYAYDLFTDIALFWQVFGHDIDLALIDIPIGLPEASGRTADRDARRLLDRRGSSVFSVPVRNALKAEDYAEGCRINQAQTGKKFSKQVWNLTPGINAVDDLMHADPQARHKLLESHPELMFWALSGSPMRYSKKTAMGFVDRMAVLRRYHPEADRIVRQVFERHQVALVEDDVVDALALAIGARLGNFVTVPDPPEYDAHGIPMQIVYPQVDLRPAIERVNHVQITVPPDQVETARRFYCDVLGLTEIPKPGSLRSRGGFWLALADQQVHVGVEDGFDCSTTKSHIAYEVDDLAYWRARLEAEGIAIGESVPIPGYDRFEFRDPSGNRVEIIQPITN